MGGNTQWYKDERATRAGRCKGARIGGQEGARTHGCKGTRARAQGWEGVRPQGQDDTWVGGCKGRRTQGWKGVRAQGFEGVPSCPHIPYSKWATWWNFHCLIFVLIVDSLKWDRLPLHQQVSITRENLRCQLVLQSYDHIFVPCSVWNCNFSFPKEKFHVAK